MRTISTLFTFTLLLYCSSCAIIPINNHFEKAGTLKKGNAEVAGNISSYTASEYSESGRMKNQHTNTNIGARIGIGLSDKTDLKFRYERMVATRIDGFKQMNYYSLVPKFSLTADEFSFLIPLSMYSYKEELLKEEVSGTVGSIAPQLLYTWTAPKKTTDLTVGVKGDFLFGEGGGTVLFGGSLGAGFSTNLTKWAIRPEIGATFISGVDLSYGIGVQYTIPKRKQ